VTDNDKNVVAIEAQKQKAIEYWEVSNVDDAQKRDVHDTVLEHLNKGLVLPIFHTLCRNINERLYSPNATVNINLADVEKIQLSHHPVQAGRDPTGSVGFIDIGQESSYISAFISNANTENPSPHLKVNESPERFWMYSQEYSQQISTLVNTPATIIGQGLEVTELSNFFRLDQESGRNLITRCLSRGVVADCFAKSHRCHNYAIVGSPGIGKSWTLIYALQQALLYENACVVLYFQKNNNAIVCIRHNNYIYVWERQHEHIYNSYLFNNSNVLLLLDPREKLYEGANFDEGNRMLIMAASNNEKHFQYIKKTKRGDSFARYLSLYTNEELKVALPYMTIGGQYLSDEELDEANAEMLKKAAIVGNLPRYIMSDENFQSRKNDTDKAIEALDDGDIKKILNFTGFVGPETTIPGCIFAVNVKVDSIVPIAKSYDDKSIDEQNKEEVVKHNDEDDEEEDDDNLSEIEEYDESAINNTGYDGQFVKSYGTCELKLMSNIIVQAVARLHRSKILSFWAKLQNTGDLGQMGYALEELFWRDLKSEKTIKMKRFRVMNSADKKAMQARGEKNLEQEHVIGNFKWDENLLDIEDLNDKVFNIEAPNQQNVYRMKANTALLDFAGPNCNVYQVTVGSDHKLSIKGLIALLLASGHCVIIDDNGTQRIEVSENAERLGKINYNWVVPEERCAIWKKRAPKSISKKSAEKKKIGGVKVCIDKFVNQFVLVLESECKGDE
jgi:Retrotransposon hot spot protein